MYVELPKEDKMYGSSLVGKLIKAMYGTRAAPKIWPQTVKKVMLSLGFEVNVLFPCVYYHPGRDLTVLTHANDFLCGGRKSDLQWLHFMLAEEFELKAEVLGEGDLLGTHYTNYIQRIGIRRRPEACPIIASRMVPPEC